MAIDMNLERMWILRLRTAVGTRYTGNLQPPWSPGVHLWMIEEKFVVVFVLVQVIEWPDSIEKDL